MKKIKKTKYVGTSKNKRAMSGGKGRQGKVSKYTQKFKNCYNIFTKISESDTDDLKNDDTKIRKMEEWGRLRGIYTYLKSKKLNESSDKTFLEQMLDNTKYSKYTQDYKNVIDCFEQNNNILLQEGCVAEKEYVNSKGGASEAPSDTKVVGQGQGDSENVYNPENVKAPVKAEYDTVKNAHDAEDEAEAEAPVKAEDDTPENAHEDEDEAEDEADAENVKAPVKADAGSAENAENTDEDQDEDDTDADSTENSHEDEDEAQDEDDTDNVYNAENVEATSSDVSQPSTSDSLASIETGSTSSEYDNKKKSHEGGRSKRSSRSSRRRGGKSKKSKKGRSTRRR